MLRSLVVCFFACVCAVVLAGCSSGSGDQAGGDSLPPPLAESFVDLAAIAGPIVAARVGETVQLNDTASYADPMAAISYDWTFAHKPHGSTAELQNANTATPSFFADVRGVYMLQLVVSANGVSSQRAVTSVIVTVPPERVTGPFNHPGLSSNCVNCHNDTNATLRGKSQTHIATGNLCQTCHTPQGFDIIPFVDHQEVFGNCSQCHNGIVAVGKSEFHFPTNAECDDCHNTTAFLELAPDGSFDHSGITRVCRTCHNGTVAIGKHEAHIATETECGYCHTTTSFLPAYPDHTGPDVVGKRCDSCHNDTNAAGPSIGHPGVRVDCAVCHSVSTFSMGGVFNHAVIDSAAQPCVDCHDGNNSINAIGKTPSPPHPATNADCGNCHNTDTFTGAFQDHTGIVNNCQSCHGVTASGKSLNHMPTTPNNPGTVNDQDCGDCHTTGTFASGSYDHAGVTTGCETCHDNVIHVGKLETHIPTTQNCEVCHQATDASFALGTFSHSGITSNCSQCHDGVMSTGKPVTHVPTSQDCSLCHVTTTIGSSASPFRDTLNFAHTGISSNCESCHNGNPHYVAVGAIGKIENHIPALNVCADCHIDKTAGGFASTVFFTNVHPDFTSGCEGCHSSPFMPTANGKLNVVKAADHLPTNQDCDVCHTNSMFVPSIFAHAGITGNCQSCHDGSAANVAVGALGMTPVISQGGTHPDTSADCGLCHSVASGTFADAIFDHTGIVNDCARSGCHTGLPGEATGMSPGHVPTSDDCNVCHVTGGSFATAVFDHNVPSVVAARCDSCHDGIHATGTAAKVNPPHVDIFGKDCDVCHVPGATFAGARYDHTGITDNCASCHNGTTAPGKTPPPDHVPTSQDCHVCHVTTGFLPASFSHTGIVDNCRSCHNNVFAIGKSVSHVPTNQDCGVCHNTTTFTGAVFDHTGIVDNCASCHNGTTARGMHDTHLATGLDCHYCHSTATCVGGSWFHDASTIGACNTCHNGTDARGQPSTGHFITTAQCDSCHTTNAWAPASTYRHPASANYPGDHNSSVTCISCHRDNNENISGFPHSTYGTSCAACHSRDYDAGEHRGTLFDNRDCGSSGCHRVSGRNWD